VRRWARPLDPALVAASLRAALVCALVLAAAGAGAQDISLNRTGSGARAAGMGNAFIAVSDDGTAASWNPAGLSQLQKPEFSIVHTTGRRGRTLDGYRTRDETSAYTTLGDASYTADIEFASAAIPFKVAGKPVTLQAGWRRLYQLSSTLGGETTRVPLTEDARPPGVVRIDAATDGSIHLWTFAGAVRLTNRLSLGASFDLFRGGWEERGNVSEEPGIAGPPDFVNTVRDNRVDGHNVSFGLLLTYPSLSVGLVYHGALQGDFHEKQSARSSLRESVEFATPDTAQLRFPRSIGAGVAWRPRPLLRFALDVTHDEWTDFLVDPTPGTPGTAVSAVDGLPPGLSATRDTTSVNVGMEKLLSAKGAFVPLRLGAAYEPQGARDPLVRDDFNYFVLAAGTGFNTNSVKLDLAVEYRWGAYDNTQDISPVYQAEVPEDYGLPPLPETRGNVGIQEWRLKVSLIYRVTNTRSFKDFLKKIFGS